MLLQVLLIVFVALLVFRGGTLATRLIQNGKEAKREFDRTTKPLSAAKDVGTVAAAPSSESGQALEPDEISSP